MRVQSHHVIGLWLLLLIAGAARADAVPSGPLTFSIQQGSSLTLLGGSRFAGAPVSSQPGDILVSQYIGDVVADNSGGVVSFPGGSSLDAQVDTSPHQPAPGGGAGSGAADYGTTLAVLLGSGQAAIRDLKFDITGQSPLGASPDPSFRFRIDPLTFTITSGTIDYRLQSSLFGTRSGSQSLVGLPVAVSGYGDFSPVPGASPPTLTLNVDLSVLVSLTADQDTHLTFEGTLLTAAGVPELAAVPALLLAAMCVLTKRPRRGPPEIVPGRCGKLLLDSR